MLEVWAPVGLRGDETEQDLDLWLERWLWAGAGHLELGENEALVKWVKGENDE